MNFDPLYYPYESRRTLVYGNKGMVCSTQPLASQAGLDILKEGGNAVDAAVATAAALTVLEPTSNGIGGDAFALFWDGNKLKGLNSSGPSPKSISIDKVKDRGYDQMPKHGWIPVTVPGVPGGWAELVKKEGNLALKEVLKPAIEYAEGGYPVSPTVGKYWKFAYDAYSKLEGDQFKHWFDVFAPKGRAPVIGETWKSPMHAKTFRGLAETEAESFYSGELGDKTAEFSQEYGGYLTKKDLETFRPEWVEPLSVDYRGHDIWELPPNGQGIIALMALNILKDFSLEEKESVDTYHKQIESIKLAFEMGRQHITDPDFMDVPPDELISDQQADALRERIGDRAQTPHEYEPMEGGTVYLATADKEGNMVSYIQSNYMGFGSGLVVPGTGIAIQNRGNTFSLDPEHINSLQPGKRTYHTIIPGFITKGGEPIGPFGVMGGYMQPQGHLQVISNMIDFDLNPQAALDAPRWRWKEKKEVVLEDSFSKQMGRALGRKGHRVSYALHSGGFGRGQIIMKNDNGYVGAAEPRADGHIAVW